MGETAPTKHEPQLCPLRRYQDLGETIFEECYEQRCAWYVENECAMQAQGRFQADAYWRQIGRQL
jgi:hypothetical protein